VAAAASAAAWAANQHGGAQRRNIAGEKWAAGGVKIIGGNQSGEGMAAAWRNLAESENAAYGMAAGGWRIVASAAMAAAAKGVAASGIWRPGLAAALISVRQCNRRQRRQPAEMAKISVKSKMLAWQRRRQLAK